MIAPLGLAGPLDDPVTNGDFDNVYMPGALYAAADGSPIDFCTGVGHQVLYGSDTWQADLAQGDVNGTADRWADDPAGEATFFSGVGHCVANGQDGNDLVWLHPLSSANKPSGWSHDANAGVVFDYDLPGDTDPFNRAAMFVQGSVHNMWQSFASTHQAFSGNHQTFEFDILNGADNIPKNAAVKISFTTTPFQAAHPWLVAFIDCDLTYKGAQLRDGLQPDGRVVLDPTDAIFRSGSSDCAEAKAEWDAGDANDRRDILDGLRMIQLSFWYWNADYAPGQNVVIDNVAMPGTPLFVAGA